MDPAGQMSGAAGGSGGGLAYNLESDRNGGAGASYESPARAGGKAEKSAHGASGGGAAPQTSPSQSSPGAYSHTPDYDSCRSLINSYFYQITMGCGTVHCTNRNCFSSPDGPRLDPTSAALLAVKLAQSTTHFLCAGAAITIPQSLQWVDTPTNSDVVPLKRLLNEPTLSSDVQVQVDLASALRRCLTSPESLAWSFLRDGRPCRATEESSGIDFDALGVAYAALLRKRGPLAVVNARGELTDSTLVDEVAGAFEALFRGAVVPAMGGGASHKFEPLRLFVVVTTLVSSFFIPHHRLLPPPPISKPLSPAARPRFVRRSQVMLFPGLMEPEYHAPVFKRLCAGINALTPAQRALLQHWLREVPAAQFRDSVPNPSRPHARS